MITKPISIEELQKIFFEIFLNSTDKVTKVSPNSVVSALGYGVAKIGQKGLKDIALIESNLFPESAIGEQLDIVADRYGISPRYSSSESSTYIRLVADEGTTYLRDVHTFGSLQGINFQLEKDVTVDSNGFTYAKVRAQSKGQITNIPPYSISKINTVLTGHQYVVNEFAAFGGRDNETDDIFLKRIKEGPNILAQTTLGMLEQVFIKINPNVLRVIFEGGNDVGKLVLGVITQNGVNLSGSELEALRIVGEQYLSLSELKPYGEDYSAVVIKNITWYPIDISFRVQVNSAFNPIQVIENIQVKLNKYLDYRFWGIKNPLDKIFRRRNIVEWDKLLAIVSETQGIDYIADKYFFPNNDIIVPKNTFPRLRGFAMLNLDGTLT